MLWFALICVGDDHKDDGDNGAILVMATAVVVLFSNRSLCADDYGAIHFMAIAVVTLFTTIAKALLSRPLGLQHAKDAGSCLNHFRHVVLIVMPLG